jgi:hypothetical protein
VPGVVFQQRSAATLSAPSRARPRT